MDLAAIIINSVWISAIAAITHHLPAYIESCHRFDPKLSECLLDRSKLLKPHLIKGIPELNLPAIDPLHVDEINLEQGTSAVNFKAKLTNVVIKGLSNYEFSQFDFDVPNIQWFIKGTVEPVELSGDYTITGKILIAPIEGRGTFTASISSCNMTFYHRCEVIKKHGMDYLTPAGSNASIQVGGPIVKMEGLLDGNTELNSVTNRIINENVDELFQEVKPVIDNIIKTIVDKTVLNSIPIVPFDELYPPIP